MAGEQYRHGTLRRYRSGCHCGECRSANSADMARRRRLAAEGFKLKRPNRPVGLRIRLWLDLGFDIQHIADAAGVARTTLERILAEPDGTTYVGTHDAVMDVRRADFAPKRWHDVGLQRRVQALAVQGWTFNDIAQAAGVHPETARNIANGHMCNSRARERLMKAFADLSARECPDHPKATRARAYAKRRGWHSLAVWDDVDSPRERPKGVAA